MPARENWDKLINEYGVDKVWKYLHAIVTLRSWGYQLWDKDMGSLTALRYAMSEILNGQCTHPGVPDIDKDDEIFGISCNICMTTWVPTTPRRRYVTLIGGSHGGENVCIPREVQDRYLLTRRLSPLQYVKSGSALIGPQPLELEEYVPVPVIANPDRYWFCAPSVSQRR